LDEVGFGQHTPFRSAIDVNAFDFAGAAVSLVMSVPGRHRGADLHVFGQNALRRLLAPLDALMTSEKQEAECYISDVLSG
jgi:hypothetical protein